MTAENDNAMACNIRRLIAEKGDSIEPGDLLIPEIQWAINCATLSSVDRRFAELRYIRGLTSREIMDELGWYSPKTFTAHNKKVWAKLVQTLRRLVG